MSARLDPIRDPRWSDFVQSHPRSSVFHTVGWLEALRRTYGFAPVAYTTARPGSSLEAGIPFCEVSSWLTGRRLVSLPFSDHCEPLAERTEDLEDILASARADAHARSWRYVQIRPMAVSLSAFERSGFRNETPFLHFQLDLRPDLDTLFGRIKKNLRYDIRRAERSDLRYVIGRDAQFVAAYYRLHVMTRSTQGVPPQPLAWFRNLADCLGEMLDVHLLLRDGTPIAGLVTILYRGQLMWKYSASDPVRDRAGMGKSLMWRSICVARERGATSLDMGRCDPENVGLAEFKTRWGARRSEVSYLRYPEATADRLPADRPRSQWVAGAAKSIIPRLPPSLLAMAGRLAYRHVA